jgi:hypothetical protein
MGIGFPSPSKDTALPGLSSQPFHLASALQAPADCTGRASLIPAGLLVASDSQPPGSPTQGHPATPEGQGILLLNQEDVGNPYSNDLT